MKETKTITINGTGVGIIIGLLVLALYAIAAFTKSYINLVDRNEYKKELIEAYEVYYDAAEQIVNDDYVNMDYYDAAKSRLDSLYRAEL